MNEVLRELLEQTTFLRMNDMVHCYPNWSVLRHNGTWTRRGVRYVRYDAAGPQWGLKWHHDVAVLHAPNFSAYVQHFQNQYE